MFPWSAADTGTAVCTTAPPVGRPIADAGIDRFARLAQASTGSRVALLCASICGTPGRREGGRQHDAGGESRDRGFHGHIMTRPSGMGSGSMARGTFYGVSFLHTGIIVLLCIGSAIAAVDRSNLERRVRADEAASSRLDRMAAVHEPARTATFCSRPGRGRARPRGGHRKHDDRRCCSVYDSRCWAANSTVVPRRGRPERERVLLTRSPISEPADPRRPARRRCLGDDAGRSQREADCHRRGICLRRDRQTRADVRAFAQRGGQPRRCCSRAPSITP